MMDKGEKIIQILESSACLKPDQLIGYLSGTLFREELRVVELHIASCRLCQEAVEGMEKSTKGAQLIKELKLPALPVRKLEIKKSTEPVASTKPQQTHADKGPYSGPSIPKSTFGNTPNQQIIRSRNYAWLGVTGIAALLLLGGYLFWQYENSASNWPSLSFNSQQNKPLDITKDSSLTENKATEKPVSKTVAETKLPRQMLPARTDTITEPDSNHTVVAANLPMTTESRQSITPATTTTMTHTQVAMKPGKDTVSEPTKKKISKAANQEPSVALSKAINMPNPPKPAPGNKPATNNATSDNSAGTSDYSVGYQLFQKKQYASALLYLKTAAESDQDPNHWQAVYYSALCNLEIGKKGRAKRQLKKVANANTSLSNNANRQLKSLESIEEN